jgi:hypothetical protein
LKNCSDYTELDEYLKEHPDFWKNMKTEGKVVGLGYDQNWMGMFQKLVEYEKQHNNTMVPQLYEKDPKLGGWVSKQRRVYKNDKLLPKRLVLLNSIDFTWNGNEAAR